MTAFKVLPVIQMRLKWFRLSELPPPTKRNRKNTAHHDCPVCDGSGDDPELWRPSCEACRGEGGVTMVIVGGPTEGCVLWFYAYVSDWFMDYREGAIEPWADDPDAWKA